MTRKEITIQLDSGLETRPVALLVQVASQYDSDIYIESDNRNINAKSFMGMMALGLVPGENVIISANGTDEARAIDGIEAYLTQKK